MSTSRNRRSRVVQSHDDPPHGNQHRTVQKGVQFIPENLIPTWGERWLTTRPRRRLDDTPTNSRAFEQGLSEFRLDSHSTPNISVHSHLGRGKPGKAKNKRTRKRCASYLPSSHEKSQPSSAGVLYEELEPDASTSEPFSPYSQSEFIATTPTLYDGPITPNVAPHQVLQFCSVQTQFILEGNPYNHDDSANSLGNGPHILPQTLSYGAAYTTDPQFQVSPFHTSAAEGAPEDSSGFFIPITPSQYHRDPDDNRCYVDAMGHGTFHMRSPSSDLSTQ